MTILIILVLMLTVSIMIYNHLETRRIENLRKQRKQAKQTKYAKQTKQTNYYKNMYIAKNRDYDIKHWLH